MDQGTCARRPRWRPPRGARPAPTPTPTEIIKAAILPRSADLHDLDLFLTGFENPKFVGKLKEDYARWKIDADRAR